MTRHLKFGYISTHNLYIYIYICIFSFPASISKVKENRVIQMKQYNNTTPIKYSQRIREWTKFNEKIIVE